MIKRNPLHSSAWVLALIALVAGACGSAQTTVLYPSPPGRATTSAATPAPAVTILPYSSPTALPASATPSPPPPTVSPTPVASPTPFGCQQPPDDYTIVRVTAGIVLNQRTISMLRHAQELYGGSHVFMKAVTQGSYDPGLAASFGTHDGGGAVDLSVHDLANFNHVLTDQFPAILLALREAGFAAWVRQPDELYQGSPLHIHAIAVGDRELSPAAIRQLTGPEGYFRGFNGLPVDPPVPDPYGPPILCSWMIDLGYADLRGTP